MKGIGDLSLFSANFILIVGAEEEERGVDWIFFCAVVESLGSCFCFQSNMWRDCIWGC